MLQIIGWLGCLYLVIKGLEIGSSSAFLDADGKAKGLSTLACMLAFGGAIVFAIWLAAQGQGIDGPTPSDYTSEKLKSASAGADCVMTAKTIEDVRACEGTAP